MGFEKEVIKELIIIDQIIDSFVKNIENINKEKIRFEKNRKEVCDNYIKKIMGIEIEDTIVFKRGKYKGSILFVEKVISNLSVIDKKKIFVNSAFFVCRLVNEHGHLSNVPRTFNVKSKDDFEKVTGVEVHRKIHWFAPSVPPRF